MDDGTIKSTDIPDRSGIEMMPGPKVGTRFKDKEGREWLSGKRTPKQVELMSVGVPRVRRWVNLADLPNLYEIVG